MQPTSYTIYGVSELKMHRVSTNAATVALLKPVDIDTISWVDGSIPIHIVQNCDTEVKDPLSPPAVTIHGLAHLFALVTEWYTYWF